MDQICLNLPRLRALGEHQTPRHKHSNWAISLDASDTSLSDGKQTSKPLAFRKNRGELSIRSCVWYLQCDRAASLCDAATPTPCLPFVLTDVAQPPSLSHKLPTQRFRTDDERGGGGGGRALTRFDRGVIDCSGDGAELRVAESGQGRVTRSPEALSLSLSAAADAAQLMSYLGQSPVTIACTGEKQGEESQWWQDINND